MTKTTLALFLKLASSGDLLSAGVQTIMAKAAQAVPREPYPGPLNNPGNMRDYGIKWKGAIRPGTRRGGYLKFDSPHNGARATSRNLVTLGTKRGIPFTISDVTAAYSAEKGKRLSDYVRNVSTISGLPSDKVLDQKNTGQMVDLLRGVIGAESGQKTLDWFRPVELTNAVLRARKP